MSICKHYTWDVDEEGTLYCTYCDANLSERNKYKKNTLYVEELDG